MIYDKGQAANTVHAYQVDKSLTSCGEDKAVVVSIEGKHEYDCVCGYMNED
jgi:hypothetical protein